MPAWRPVGATSGYGHPRPVVRVDRRATMHRAGATIDSSVRRPGKTVRACPSPYTVNNDTRRPVNSRVSPPGMDAGTMAVGIEKRPTVQRVRCRRGCVQHRGWGCGTKPPRNAGRTGPRGQDRLSQNGYAVEGLVIFGMRCHPDCAEAFAPFRPIIPDDQRSTTLLANKTAVRRVLRGKATRNTEMKCNSRKM